MQMQRFVLVRTYFEEMLRKRKKNVIILVIKIFTNNTSKQQVFSIKCCLQDFMRNNILTKSDPAPVFVIS